jgi:hypothetical protein
MSLISVLSIVIVFVGMMGAIVFPRETKNLIVAVTKRKKYVICYLKHAHTGFVDKHFVVPSPDKLTKVKNYSYTLDDKFASYTFKNRPVFILREECTLPEILDADKIEDWRNKFERKMPYKTLIEFKVPTKEYIIFQTKATQTALDNNVASFLFKNKDGLIMLIIGVLFIIMVIVTVYDIITIQKTNTLLDYIASQQVPQVTTK